MLHNATFHFASFFLLVANIFYRLVLIVRVYMKSLYEIFTSQSIRVRFLNNLFRNHWKEFVVYVCVCVWLF